MRLKRIGEKYKFTYHTTCEGDDCDYIERSGKIVTVIGNAKCIFEDNPAYHIVCNEGWKGIAYHDELEEVK